MAERRKSIGMTGDSVAIAEPSMRIVDSESALVKGGSWTKTSDADAVGGSVLRSNVSGSSLQFTFRGTSIWVRFRFGSDAGIAIITMDGVQSGTVDLYNLQSVYKYVSVGIGLTSGVDHTLTVTVSSSKNAGSTDYYVNVDAFAYRVSDRALTIHDIEYIDLINVINVINRINQINLISTIANIQLLSTITKINELSTIDQISSIASISEIAGISTVGAIGSISHISHIGMISQISDIGGISAVGHIGLISQISEITKIDELSTINQIAGISDIAGISAIGHIGMISQISDIAGISAIGHIGMISQISEIATIKTIELIQAMPDITVKGSEAVPFKQVAAGAGAWTSPTDFLDSSGTWTDEPLAYDDDLLTATISLLPTLDWGQFLILTVPEMYSNKLRINTTLANISHDMIDVDVYKDGVWSHAYEGAPVDGWHEIAYAAGNVTKMRMRLQSST